MLTERGLVPTLQRYIVDFNRFFGKHAVLSAEPLPDLLTDDQQLALFRIVQESLQNIQKHASTQNAWIEIARQGDDVVLQIRDDGRGFDDARSPDVSTGGGAGLPGMRERARLIGASLSVTTSPGAGVTIRLALPVTTSRSPAPTLAPDEESSR